MHLFLLTNPSPAVTGIANKNLQPHQMDPTSQQQQQQQQQPVPMATEPSPPAADVAPPPLPPSMAPPTATATVGLTHSPQVEAASVGEQNAVVVCDDHRGRR